MRIAGIFILLLYSFCTHAQPLHKVSGFSCSEFNIVPTHDGGYFDGMHRIIGGLSRASLLKTDSTFNTVWHREYYGPDIVAPVGVRMIYDQGFVTACKLRYPFSNYLALLIKVNANGDTSWMKAYEEFGSDVILTGMETLADSNIIFFGQKTNPERLFLMKTDAFGNLLWERNYFNPVIGFNECNGIATSDGGFALTGGRWGIIKTDSIGDVLWYLPFEFDTYYNTYRHLVQLSNNTLLLVGMDDVAISMTYDLFYINTDFSGNILQNNIIPSFTNILIKVVLATPDGGCLLTGGLHTTGNYSTPFVMKLDSALQPVWNNRYLYTSTTNQYGSFGSVAITNGGDYVFSGSATSSVSLPPHLMVTTYNNGYTCNHLPVPLSTPQPFVPTYHQDILTDTSGMLIEAIPTSIIVGVHSPNFWDVCQSTGIFESIDPVNMMSLVNDGNGNWTVQSKDPSLIADLKMYDIRGVLILSKPAVRNDESIEHFTFSKGIYFYNLSGNHGIITGKIYK